MADKNSIGSASTSAFGAESSGLTIGINVKTLESQVYSFQVNRNISIPSLKEKVANETGVPAELQRLIFKGRVLKDDHMLCEYHVEDGDTLHLVTRPPGQPQTPTGPTSGEVNFNIGNRGCFATFATTWRWTPRLVFLLQRQKMSEEKIQMCSNGSSGRLSSRKIKQNKVPQRGLGVEKLERIRLEEQRKNGAVHAAAVPRSIAATHTVPSIPVSIQCPSISYSSSSPVSEFSNMSSNNTLLGLGLHQTPKKFPENTNQTTCSSVAGPAFGWPIHGTGSSLNSENKKLESGFLNGSSFPIQNDLKANWSPLLQTQWSHHNQQISYSTLVEPHLNQPAYNYGQINFSNYMNPVRCEAKMVGLKRSWPFSPDNLQESAAFPHNVASLAAYGSNISNVREGTSGSSSNNISWVEKNLELRPNKKSKDDLILDGDFLNPTNKRTKGNGILDGDFLSLGLSTSTTCSSTIKFKPSFTFPPPDYQELSKIDVLAFQGSIEDQVNHSIGFIQHQYSFFPSDERHTTQSMSTKAEVGESLDLTLKL